jgi:hypothetical protein
MPLDTGQRSHEWGEATDDSELYMDVGGRTGEEALTGEEEDDGSRWSDQEG